MSAQKNEKTLDFKNSPGSSWDKLAEQVSLLEFDGAWTSRHRQFLHKDECDEAIITRFYLKLVYAVFTKIYNYGAFRYRFARFEMPDSHFENWRSLSKDSRAELFGKMRFTSVGDDAQNDNSFLIMFDDKMLNLIGHLDTVYVARHGLQIPRNEIVMRQATREEALRYARYRVAHDETVLKNTEALFREGEEEKMTEADKAGALAFIQELVVLVKQGRTIEANLERAAKLAEMPASPKVDADTGVTLETLEKLGEFRAQAVAFVDSVKADVDAKAATSATQRK